MYISYYLKKNRNRNVYCSITINKKRHMFSTGHAIDPAKWGKNNKEYALIKKELNKIEAKLNDIYEAYEENGIMPTITKVMEAYNNPVTKKARGATVTDAFNYHSDLNRKDQYKVNLNSNLLAKWSTLMNNDETLISDIHKTELIGFIKAMEDDGLFYSTRMVYFTRFLLIIRTYIFDHDLNIAWNYTRRMFRAVLQMTEKDKKIKMEEKSKLLTREEQKKIIEAKFEGDQNVYHKAFLLQMYSGLAYREISSFDPEVHIITLMDGQQYIRIKRKKTVKTKEYSTIPLDSRFMDIYRQIDLSLINDYHKYMQFLKRVLGDQLINREITTHMGRHTFGSNMLEEGYSMEAVSHMLGHASISQTEDVYAHVTVQKIENERKKIQGL